MATYDEFLAVDASGFDVLEDLQADIRSALNEGRDPGPELAFSVLHLVAKISEANQRTDSVQVRLLDLETRILNAGVHLGNPEE